MRWATVHVLSLATDNLGHLITVDLRGSVSNSSFARLSRIQVPGGCHETVQFTLGLLACSDCAGRHMHPSRSTFAA